MADEIARRFVDALASKDAASLKRLLRADLDFMGLTPGQHWAAGSADQFVDDVLFGRWFEASDEITGLIHVETGEVGSRTRVSYQLAVTNADGPHLVEQQAYLETDGTQITWLRVMCAGYQPVTSG